MKKIHLLAMLLFTACVVPVSQAQESLFLKDPSTKNKLLQLDLDVGTCFDLAYRGEGKYVHCNVGPEICISCYQPSFATFLFA
ncbi:hypothetical protein NXW26_09460 [Bacteroides faecis]|nr:hypothetical protein [Bacteroides faecis]UVR66964.1 hypothetical protein NXW26_09460 [Bacteroides faecis]